MFFHEPHFWLNWQHFFFTQLITVSFLLDHLLSSNAKNRLPHCLNGEGVLILDKLILLLFLAVENRQLIPKQLSVTQF